MKAGMRVASATRQVLSSLDTARALSNMTEAMTEILVIGSETETAGEAHSTLKELGFQVAACTTGAEALAYLSGEHSVRAVFCSWNLQDGSAVDLLLDMRQRTLRVPVVIMTLSFGVDVPTRAFRAGAADVIFSPFARDIISHKARQYAKADCMVAATIALEAGMEAIKGELDHLGSLDLDPKKAPAPAPGPDKKAVVAEFLGGLPENLRSADKIKAMAKEVEELKEKMERMGIEAEELRNRLNSAVFGSPRSPRGKEIGNFLGLDGTRAPPPADLDPDLPRSGPMRRSRRQSDLPSLFVAKNDPAATFQELPEWTPAEKRAVTTATKESHDAFASLETETTKLEEAIKKRVHFQTPDQAPCEEQVKLGEVKEKMSELVMESNTLSLAATKKGFKELPPSMRDLHRKVQESFEAPIQGLSRALVTVTAPPEDGEAGEGSGAAGKGGSDAPAAGKKKKKSVNLSSELVKMLTPEVLLNPERLLKPNLDEIVEAGGYGLATRAWLQSEFFHDSQENLMQQGTGDLPFLRAQTPRTGRGEAGKKGDMVPTLPSGMSVAKRWDLPVYAYTDEQCVSLIKCIFDELGLVSRFNIDATRLHEFVATVGRCYRNVPYHNFTHAADVMYATYMFLMRTRARSLLTDIDLFAMMVAALCHDVDHPGLNNAFLIQTSNPLALLYNDQSVLESHHAHVAFALMQHDKTNILDGLSTEEYWEFRRLVIRGIMGTDMSQHFALQSKFSVHCDSVGRTTGTESRFRKDHREDRELLLETILHAMDICSTARPFPVMRAWTLMLVEEFFNQGDFERQHGLPVSPSMNRGKDQPIATQIRFMDFVVAPYLNTLRKAFPEVQDLIDNLAINRTRIKELENDQNLLDLVAPRRASVSQQRRRSQLPTVKGLSPVSRGHASSPSNQLAQAVADGNTASPEPLGQRPLLSSSSILNLAKAPVSAEGVVVENLPEGKAQQLPSLSRAESASSFSHDASTAAPVSSLAVDPITGAAGTVGPMPPRAKSPLGAKKVLPGVTGTGTSPNKVAAKGSPVKATAKGSPVKVVGKKA